MLEIHRCDQRCSLACLGLKAYDSYDIGAPLTSTHRGLATSSGNSSVIISPFGNWLLGDEVWVGGGRKQLTIRSDHLKSSFGKTGCSRGGAGEGKGTIIRVSRTAVRSFSDHGRSSKYPCRKESRGGELTRAVTVCRRVKLCLIARHTR